ncbi:hypothetical protein D3C73_1107920 [compost metagenome]
MGARELLETTQLLLSLLLRVVLIAFNIEVAFVVDLYVECGNLIPVLQVNHLLDDQSVITGITIIGTGINHMFTLISLDVIFRVIQFSHL